MLDKVKTVVQNPKFQQAVKTTAATIVTLVVINVAVAVVNKAVEIGMEKLTGTETEEQIAE